MAAWPEIGKGKGGLGKSWSPGTAAKGMLPGEGERGLLTIF